MDFAQVGNAALLAHGYYHSNEARRIFHHIFERVEVLT